MKLKFAPLDWVRITFCGVNYHGRITKAHIGPNNDHTYTVEYVGDDASFKSGDFRDDELEKAP